MAQPPFQTDVLQIEPGATGTRTVSRASTGELLFTDPTFPSGIVLADLAGVQSISGVFVVGAGGGASYTTLQDAIDAVAATSSSSAPTVILIYPGVYTENLTISKDGVILVGQGYVKITNAAADSTIKVIQDINLIPKFVRLINLTVENTDLGEECLTIDGADTFASGTVTVVTAPLAAGDKVTIGGIDLTGISGTRTSGSNNFNAALLTTIALAAEIAAAINDTGNAFAASVTASASSSVVTITANTAGVGGNSITLAVTTTPVGGLAVSGATLTGGGGAGSEVAEEEVALIDCILLATGVGTRQIVMDTANNLRVHGGTWFGSSSTSACVINQAASFKLFGVAWVNDLQVAYDTGNDQPSIMTSEWSSLNVGRMNDLLINLIGAGSTILANCPEVGDLTHNGDRTLDATSCRFGNMLIEDTVVANLVNCTRGTLGGAGTPTVAESTLTGTVTFVASSSELVTFDRPQPDTSYAVYLDCPTLGNVPQVTAKTTTDFTVSTSVALSATVSYTVVRQMP